MPVAKHPTSLWLIPLVLVLIAIPRPLASDDKPEGRCNEDAMLVFDGSGSMSGNERFGIGSMVTRIDRVREALAQVLPAVSPLRNIGLVTIGPGAFNKCDDVALKLRPVPNAGERIMAEVDQLVPSGRTPLADAVTLAADALDFREKPSVIVVLTDGDDTCNGAPCVLARKLRAEARHLTIHVIGYRLKDWTSDKGYFESRCLADETGGLYAATETVDELIAALQKMLGCPFITDTVPAARRLDTASVQGARCVR